GAIIMKLGRTFPAVRSALAQAGRLDGAWYVERASQPEERWLPVTEVDDESVPYFSLIVVPGDSGREATAARMRTGRPDAVEVPTAPATTPADLLVVGLGPGPDAWLTPEVSAALS